MRKSIVLKKLVLPVQVLLSAVVVLINGAAIIAGTEKVTSKLVFAVHVVTLYAKAPDQKLEMPVQGVTRSQIADTWHVPRAGDAIGDHVTTQTILGYVGNTGNAAGGPTHLHFGVYEREGALNPLPLLADRPAEKNTARTPRIEPARKSR